MYLGNGNRTGQVGTLCTQCPLRGRRALREFSAEELGFVQELKSDELRIQPGASFLREGTRSEQLYTVLHGWAFRYKMLDDGRRQILNYALPGDMVGLQGALMSEMEHSVEALTPLTLCVFPRAKLLDLYKRFPALAFDVTWLAAREEQLIDENLLSLGRRTALERTAYLFLHLFVRAEELGLAARAYRAASLHPAARRRHARSLAGAHQQDAEAPHRLAGGALEGPPARGARPRRARPPRRQRHHVEEAAPVHLMERAAARRPRPR